MIRTLIVCLALLAARGIAAGAEQGQLDASPALFTVLAAINAAGYDAELDSPNNHPLRDALRKEIAARKVPSLEPIRRFYAAHKQADPTADLSQYISYALSVTAPPDFKFRFRTLDLPPDAAVLQDLTPLLVRFYNEAGIEELWKRSQPAFEQAIGRYHTPVTQAVLAVNAYLHNATRGYLGRRFQIYLELLAAPNQIQSRSYADDYFIVLTPSQDPQVDDVRHAYLHYLLDPLGIKNGENLLKKKSIGDLAQAAPALPEYFKSDFVLLATESLIKAVESRLTRGSPAQKQAVVQQALAEGFILTPFFAEQLPLFEKQEQDMRQYLPQMVEQLDLKIEDARLAGVKFATQTRVRKAKVVPAERKVEPTGVFKTAEDAERLYTARDLGKARETWMRVLGETDQKPLHARAYYGLARIAVLEKDPELAEKLFEKALELEPDPYVKGWTLVYLGRLADAAGDRDQAARYYKDAVGVAGASVAARQAAQKGIEQVYKK